MGHTEIALALCLVVIAFWAWGRKGRPAQEPSASARFPLGPSDWMEESDFFSHCLITGQTGSGKSSGPMAAIIRHLMLLGWGMMITIVKSGETDSMLALARQCGREADFIRFSPSSGLAYDFLAYELSQPGGSPQSAARLLALAVDINSRSSGKGGDEQFWQLLGERIFLVAITAIWLATGTCSVKDVHRFVSSMPTSPEQIKDPAWIATSYCLQTMLQAEVKHKGGDINICCDFLMEWIGLSEKTRSVADTLVKNVTSQFLMGKLSEMVAAGRIDVSPDDVLKGKILCLDASILVYGTPALFLQAIMKTQLQKAAQRRDLQQNSTPTALVCDEAQYTIVPSEDLLALTTTRSAKLAHIWATQGLPACYAQLGGTEKARHEVDGMIGNFAHKIITANGCTATNKYMAEMIGGDFRLMANGQTNQEPWNPIDEFMGQRINGSAGFSEQYFPLIPDGEMSRMATGGAANGYRVDAIVFAAGRRFSNGKTFLRTSFNQRAK